jgi:GAF domain-containing protein/HAMP domain-containing protein
MISREAQAKKPSRTTSLAATMATTFVLLSVLILLIVGSVQIYFNFQTQQELEVRRQRLEASEAAHKVADFIGEIFDTLDAAVRVGRLEAVPTEERRLWLDNLIDVHPALRTLSYADETGKELAKVSTLALVAPSQLTSYAGTELLTVASQDQRFISSVDVTSGEPLVKLGIPVKNISDRFEGVLVAEVDLRYMWDVVDEIKIGQTGFAYVVDQQGNVIAYPGSDKEKILQNFSHVFEVAEFISGNDEEIETGFELEAGINGERVVSTYIPLGTPNWAVVVETPILEAFQDLIWSLVVSAVILLSVAILAGGAGIYAARRLTAPVLSLTSTATRIAEGELDLEVQPEGPTEIVRLGNAFNSMNRQLRDLIDSLEQRIEARTQRLETVASLGERFLSILNVDELLAEMVNRIKDTFGYYHAHVYLLDNKGENLTVAQGAGSAGAEMKAQGHTIPLATLHSLVARAARSGEIVRVDNVREVKDWLPNPLLPDTYSEMAVPIILEGQVVGVLDVQQDKVAGLDEGDANLLRSLVNQVATAIRNARLFNQVETALAEAYAAQERYVEQSWAKSKVTSLGSRHLYVQPSVTLDKLKEQAIAKLQAQALAQNFPTITSIDEEGSLEQALVAPINLRNRTIGALQLHHNGQPWTRDDLAVIEAVVDQLAQTAESLRLFDETRQRADYERLVGDITQKLRQAPTLDILAKTAGEELSRVLGVSHSIIKIGLTSAEPQAPVPVTRRK